jgi:hypothetical protein
VVINDKAVEQARVYTDQGIVGPGETTDASQGNVPFIRQLIPAMNEPRRASSKFGRWD